MRLQPPRAAAPATRPTLTATLALILAVFTAGCGGSDGSTGPTSSSNGRYFMTAKIDGTAWAEDALQATTLGVVAAGSGVYTITGFQTSSATTIAISLFHITGPGTFPLGSNVSIPAGSAQVSNTTSGWSTVIGGSGSITITSLTATEMIGTFNFTAGGIFNAPSTSIKTVTTGSFDLPVMTR